MFLLVEAEFSSEACPLVDALCLLLFSAVFCSGEKKTSAYTKPCGLHLTVDLIRETDVYYNISNDSVKRVA